jgi:diguanylate cyclase (GGDEF)-like protein
MIDTNAFGLVPYYVYIIDVSTYEIQFVNNSLKKKIGNAVGKKCWESIYGNDSKCAFCKVDELLTPEGFPNEETAMFEVYNEMDERWYQVQEQALIWFNKKLIKHSNMIDVTELKETQNKLAEAHALLALKNKQLEGLVITDALTSLYNRRYIESCADQEIERTKRYGTGFSVIMLDIDHFKKINDTYGHQVGDDTLRFMGKTLEKNTRTTDITGRWGGEEFIILCPNLDIGEATELAEKIRTQVEKVEIIKGVSLTLSCGVSVYRNEEDFFDTLKRADDSLYLAKNNGRNCTYTEKDL